ncbi:hypothetical protein AVEN_257046-1 [Araneus ventricosus]|uniref:Histone-lysine N-methyltransferase SETMAR n=1 Tax=Araneus ventricosus TaxID=182803 RepID=A0A4Y2MCJ7_ARAVE|nr:hypothetical protein AVEN_257046-1 [Araneus ventricosus]
MQVYRNRWSFSRSSRQLLEQLKWDVSDHPLYNPDLAMSNFHLFLELKNWLGGQSFQKKKELQSNIKAHLTSLPATFFEKRIRKLVCRNDQ